MTAEPIHTPQDTPHPAHRWAGGNDPPGHDADNTPLDFGRRLDNPPLRPAAPHQRG